MLLRNVKLVALGAAGAIAAGTAIAIVGIARKRRAKRAIPRGIRKDIVRVIEAAGAEVNPAGKVGESLLRHVLEDMSDKQLIAIYAALKVAQAVKDSDIDLVHASREKLAHFREHFNEARRGTEGRQGILRWLFEHRVEELHPLLALALKLSS